MMKEVYIQGVKGRGSDVISRLKNLGGHTISANMNGEDSGLLYFVTDDGAISAVMVSGFWGRYIKAKWKEQKL